MKNEKRKKGKETQPVALADHAMPLPADSRALPPSLLPRSLLCIGRRLPASVSGMGKASARFSAGVKAGSKKQSRGLSTPRSSILSTSSLSSSPSLAPLPRTSASSPSPFDGDGPCASRSRERDSGEDRRRCRLGRSDVDNASASRRFLFFSPPPSLTLEACASPLFAHEILVPLSLSFPSVLSNFPPFSPAEDHHHAPHRQGRQGPRQEGRQVLGRPVLRPRPVSRKFFSPS